MFPIAKSKMFPFPSCLQKVCTVTRDTAVHCNGKPNLAKRIAVAMQRVWTSGGFLVSWDLQSVERSPAPAVGGWYIVTCRV
jgi:hypothetical protein